MPNTLYSLLNALIKLTDEAAPPQATGTDFSYQLITKRQVETHNSWTHNLPDFLTRLEQQNFIYMNPEDAARENFAEHAPIDVDSGNATIRLPLKINKDLSRGVVAIPHGWGHQNSGQRYASESQGVNVNLLARSGVANIDPLSGMSQLTGLRVTLNATPSTTDTPLQTASSSETPKSDWSGH